MFFVTEQASCDPLGMSIHSFDKYFCVYGGLFVCQTLPDIGASILTQIHVISAFMELTV